MSDLKQYEDAMAKYNESLNIKALPIVAWDFYHEFLEKKNSILLDLNKVKSIAEKNKWEQDNWDLDHRLNEEVIVLTDAKLEIVFVSHNMIRMNGYKESEVLGKSPKFFHGLETSQQTSKEIREAIQNKLPFEKTVINYKKTGEIYSCLIKGYPIFNVKGELTHFIAYEKAA
jgi:PAS domain S-box-containing protein